MMHAVLIEDSYRADTEDILCCLRKYTVLMEKSYGADKEDIVLI
jgi:hypothetical protein